MIVAAMLGIIMGALATLVVKAISNIRELFRQKQLQAFNITYPLTL